MHAQVLVIGTGEVGRPLAEVLGSAYPVVTKDIEPLALESVDVMHVCYPFNVDDFIGTTVTYAKTYSPRLMIVNSTVVPGTTRRIGEESGVPIAYSPVRGKHSRMAQELMHYSKFVASPQTDALQQAVAHFQTAGMTVEAMGSPEALELAKLLETSYFGVLLGWAQEMERLTDEIGGDYLDVQRFMEEIDFLPRVVFQPGFIGGHCVIPNSHLLDLIQPSLFMDAMRRSNEIMERDWLAQGRPLDERVSPKRLRPE